VLTAAEAADLSTELKSSGQTIVFTNGCFDLLHRGHIHVLSEARAFGDILFVGLNSDDSVRRLKGPARPIQLLDERETILTALRVVDFVVPFEEDTPLNLIELILPDVLVKGGDYSVDTVVGANAVMAGGGRVEIVKLLPGYSTSSLLGNLMG
jgi:D-beta-D-heptose 7-phosphate kinase/D-beta-D-heptose 1-phosphate adenosyltransferase